MRTAHVGKRLTYEFSIEIPSSPSKSVKVVQLLSNDRMGATRIYGYTLGRGIMEEDHGPHFRYDCLIDQVVVK